MTAGHVGELALRRLRLGELAPSATSEVDAHVKACAECRGRLASLAEEQARFVAQVPFERFAAGVERAQARAGRPARPTWVAAVTGMAAAALVAVVVQPVLSHSNRIKGGAGMVLRIAGPAGGPQRLASPDAPEALASGERVRIGYQPGGHRYVAAVSVDEAGQVTPLYPEFGRSLPTDEGEATYYLPDSVEFTGRGSELVLVVLGDQPLAVDALVKATRAAFEAAHGDLNAMGPLPVRGEQFRRMLLKPN